MKNSIDTQYFIWQNDDTGALLFDRLLKAADRGVRVRLLVDDFLFAAISSSRKESYLQPTASLETGDGQCKMGRFSIFDGVPICLAARVQRSP